MIGYSKGKYITTSNITIAADSIAANRGYGAFDFLCVINGKPFYLDRHIDRFFNTMDLMRLSIEQSPEQLYQIIYKLIEQTNLDNFFIKLFAYPVEGFLGDQIKCELHAIPVVIPSDASYDYENGIKLITKEYQRFLPEAKSTNYLPLVYWQNEISAANAVDVLYYSNGSVRETSRGNVFVVKGGQVITPNEKILKGISRSVVIDILKEKRIPFIEQTISIKDLYSADEVFLSSTTKKILPVVQLEEKKIGDGTVGLLSKRLMFLFEEIQNNWT